ncbi:uncharacterized protein LOC126911643 [Spodoptera frugiperda]|uniref:Uncharacterized protein LOC126911643 n=1 Tax=Spodoptera frugiperda TaxID=7108 RepID=A0A9R0DYX4_SPOFR|nr:uncharacterized protein LOC126911643 [Spodoptera frugiperda]
MGRDSELRELVRKRGNLRGRLTLFEKYINSLDKTNILEQQVVEIKLRVANTETIFSDFQEVQSEIEGLSDEPELSTQLEIRESIESQFYSSMSLAKTCICNKGDDNITKPTKGNTNSVKLPTITLPSFDGTIENWLEFRDTFTSLIHNATEITPIQKYHYLRSSLKGSALQVIKSLDFCSDNYAVAWELLTNRFDNNKLLINNHVQSLFTLPTISKESPVQLRKIIDSVLKNLRSLKNLGESTEHWDTLVIFLITTKLDPNTCQKWEDKKNTFEKDYKPKLDDIIEFLKNRSDVLDMLKAQGHKQNTDSPKRSIINSSQSQQMRSFVANKQLTRASTSAAKSSRAFKCIMCDGSHALYSCITFLNLSVQDRLTFVQNKRNVICTNCLRTGHALDDCQFGPCKQCAQKHNSLIHVDNTASCNSLRYIPTLTHTDAPANNATDSAHANTSSLGTNSITSYHSKQAVQSNTLDQVLLSTALVEVCNNNNTYTVARALLDSGSQRCFVTESLCKKLHLPTIQSTLNISGIGNSVMCSEQSCDLVIRSRFNDFSRRLNCSVLPKITFCLPNSRLDFNSFQIPQNVKLADPDYYVPSEIDILIGADVFWDLLQVGLIRLPTGPYLQNTRLGWVISGTVLGKKVLSTNNQTSSNNNIIYCSLSTSLEGQLKRFWELEEVDSGKSSNNTYTEDDRLCEDLFTSTTIRDSEGRFAVRIPLRESADSHGDSYESAKNRFLSLERKLDRSPELKGMYSDFLKEYLALGHMTRIDRYLPPYYFLPHHCVQRESTTTKLRVVFDAGAQTSSGKSLNDLQLIGPPLLNDLVGILLRFRQYTFVACADVEKMFRQVLVQADQRQLQLILWRDSKQEPLGIYQLNTVTYGTASAPYLAMRCLRQLAFECDDELVSSNVLNSFYCDDLIFSHDNKQELLTLCENINKTLLSGCFPLRKWSFNFDVSPSDSFTKSLSLDKNAQCKTLGLGWCNSSDELHFKTNLNIDVDVSQLTKRKILSFISQIYDPLGLLAPVIITTKILIQKLWLYKIGWDDPVSSDLACLFSKIVSSFQYLPQIRVPRHVTTKHVQYLQLHIFTDASQDAYGACAYIRSVSTSNEPVVKLLCAKSKVAPLKPVSIPRLELCGALVGARLYKKIIESINLTFNNTYFWTDSTIVLGWLRTHPIALKTFVQNRVVEINDLTSGCTWSHVSGVLNPADMLTRGVNLPELVHKDLWWNGPGFILDGNLEKYNLPDIPSDLPELKPDKVVGLHASCNSFPFDKFSSFVRMTRCVAYMLRFIHNTRHKTNHIQGALSVEELRRSTILLARLSQIDSFPDEYKSLSIKSSNIKYSRNMSGLNLFFCDDLVIRVGGRLGNSDEFTYDKKHPILICSKHKFTSLLFEFKHKYLLHAGPQSLLATIREEWWPLGGRNLARSTVQRCLRCVRMKGKTLSPIMGNLPSSRLKPGFPFLITGTDYCGPVHILNRQGKGSRLIKCYICIFVCFATRALHLELVTTLTTNGYLLCLKRFISRRGKPAVIYSDNGKNYVGAAKDLGDFLANNSATLMDSMAGDEISFKFIPPYSPHFGGLWEAGVRSCKYHLRRVVGNSNLTFEEFYTVLVQIEAVLNSRPLTPLSSDPNDLLALTPAHFLIGRPLTTPICEDITDAATYRLPRYDRIEQMRQHFWQRWSKEFVSELQTRTKWQKNKGDLNENTLVLIKEENQPPLKWRLGRVLAVHTGKDGVSRVAKIRTASGEILRSFSKICPLPVDITPTENQVSRGGAC